MGNEVNPFVKTLRCRIKDRACGRHSRHGSPAPGDQRQVVRPYQLGDVRQHAAVAGDGAQQRLWTSPEAYPSDLRRLPGVGGPKGTAGLKIRAWACGCCSTVHDRGVAAARSILRLGRQALAEGSSTLSER